MANADRILIGRDAELEELSSLLGVGVVRDAVTGADSVRQHVLLAGDAGVGKTRLLQELAALASTRGWQAYAGHCLDFGDSALPYLPFSEILDRLMTQLPDVVERVSTSHPALSRLLPTGRETAPDARADTVDRGQLFAAVHALLEALSDKAPALVVIEDAHWADQSTRDLLTYLFTRPFAGPVALVASYRADDLHRRHPLRRQVAEWARLGAVGRVVLDPLGDDQVRALVAFLDPAVRGADREDIVARAEGNAFFVEELVGAAGGPGHWIPDELADVLLVRLDRLDETTRTVVRTASVAGRRVGHELLAAVVGLEAPALDEALRHAVESHVLVAGEGAYWFRHALLGEAVYDDLLPGERVRLHGQFAAALADCGGRESPLGSAAELARHARLALDLDTALVASVRAGDEAAAVGGPDEAAHHYERALVLLGERPVPDGVSPARVVEACVVALTTAGRPDRAARIAEEQLERLPADTPPGDRARILTAAAMAVGIIDNAELDPLDASDRALALVPDGDPVLRARVLADRALLLHWRGSTADAQIAGAEALALAERHDQPAIASAAATTLTALGKSGDPTQLRAALQAVIDRAVASGALTPELQGRFLLARSYEDWGEWPAAEAAFRAGVERSEAAGQPWAPYGFEPRQQLAWVLYVVGRWDEALDLVKIARPGSPPVPYAALDAIRQSIRQGRGEKVPRRLHRDTWESDGIVPVFSAATEMIAAGRAGAPREAVVVYDEVVALLSRLWHPWFVARLRLAAVALGVLADAMPSMAAAERAALLPDIERLASDGATVIATYDDARGWGPEGQAWEARLTAEALRARWLAGAEIDPAELVGAWREAERSFATFGHVIETATVRVALAGILRATGDTAGAAQAAELARAAARELGARPLLDALGSPATRVDPAGSDALTRREAEILALVADGRTNGEIGKLLFISTKTVSVHVSNILAKLGASGRTEAAAIARRRGLV
ncbi:LuxR family transcriptional regulator [Nocardioides sp. CER19]|uniref:helix-turn-helix transcriptional regulator n=1 Tax=Nocardioides sp. CER19 TaxID=3038538 RepID=UPI00244BA344|nr:LuxR family transcriptional regulator [Nocardioides sp. CER19]MDH2413222.1 AAA family ATPase [Nocardioides sp. CER19]